MENLVGVAVQGRKHKRFGKVVADDSGRYVWVVWNGSKRQSRVQITDVKVIPEQKADA